MLLSNGIQRMTIFLQIVEMLSACDRWVSLKHRIVITYDYVLMGMQARQA